MLRHLALAALALAGCQANPNPAQVANADPQVAAYQQAVGAYIAEARATAKLVETWPTKEKMLERHLALEDMHSKLPEPPAHYTHLQDELKELTFHSRYLAEAMRIREEFLRLGARAKSNAVELEAGMKQGVDVMLAKVAVVEAEMGR